MVMRPLLILVHIEDSFRYIFPEMYIPRVVKAARNHQTIHFTSYIDNFHPIEELSRFVDREVIWGWGHHPDMFDADEQEWVIPSNSPHEWTHVPVDLRHLKNQNIILGGGAAGECLANMEACLDFLNLSYRKVDGLVYGN